MHNDGSASLRQAPLNEVPSPISISTGPRKSWAETFAQQNDASNTPSSFFILTGVQVFRITMVHRFLIRTNRDIDKAG